MYELENQLTIQLLNTAKSRVAQANSALSDISEAMPDAINMSILAYSKGLIENNTIKQSDSQDNAQTTDNVSYTTPRSIYGLLHHQSVRINEMAEELAVAKQNLYEQKRINRAKILVMQQFKLSEAKAHQRLQKAAMNQGVSMAEIASNVIDATNKKIN